MKFIDLFCGVGGFRLALERNGHECVFSSDIDKYKKMIYNYNFGEWPHDDITKIKTYDIPDFDILCSGFPCQSFSIAGQRKGFSDTRGTMFFEICRILYDKRPSMVILENVKGLLNHEGGRTFHRILESLQKLGYVGQWQVLNSKNFGVPQNRERVFIVGYLGGGSGSQIFPIPESYGRSNESHETPQGEGERLRSDGSSYALNPLHFRNDEGIREYTKSDTTSSLSQPSGNNGSLVASTLQGRDYKGGGNLVAKTLRVGGGGPRGENLIELSENAHESRRVYDPNGIAKTIKAKAGGLGAKTGLYIIKKHRKDEIRDRGQVSPTLTESRDHHGGANPPMVTNDIKIRRLTPKECERLQSFPDNYTLYGKTEDGTIVEMSDTQRYKAMGDAVTVNVVEMVAYYLTHELKIDKINKVKSLEEFF